MIIAKPFADVTASLSAIMNVDEGDGSVQVCVALFSFEDIERDFVITLNTNDDTGKIL